MWKSILIGFAVVFLWEVICSASFLDWAKPSFFIELLADEIKHILSSLGQFVAFIWAWVAENIWLHVRQAADRLLLSLCKLILSVFAFFTGYYEELIRHLPVYHIGIIMGTIFGSMAVALFVWFLERKFHFYFKLAQCCNKHKLWQCFRKQEKQL